MAQKIDTTRDASVTPDAGGPLHFEGSIDLSGAITAQQLGVLFGREATVTGKLRFDGAVTIDGTFRGAITTRDLLIVGEKAVIEADVACGAATIGGEVTGNIIATDSVALQSTARVKGDITSPALSVDKGAMFDGTSRLSATKAKKPAR